MNLSVKNHPEILRFLLLEYAAIFRNHRVKAVVPCAICAFAFLVLFVIFWSGRQSYHTLVMTGEWAMTFYSVLLTGCFVYSSNSLLSLSFMSSFYSYLTTRPVSLYKIFLYKYLILAASVLLSYLIFLPIGLSIQFNQRILFITALYNAGAGSVIILFSASRNIARVNLSKGAFLNSEGWGFIQSLVMWINVVIPVITYHAMRTIIRGHAADAIFIFLSLFIIVTHRVWILLIIRSIHNRRYQILSRFTAGDS